MTLEQRVELLEKEILNLKEQLVIVTTSTSHSVIQIKETLLSFVEPSSSQST